MKKRRIKDLGQSLDLKAIAFIPQSLNLFFWFFGLMGSAFLGFAPLIAVALFVRDGLLGKFQIGITDSATAAVLTLIFLLILLLMSIAFLYVFSKRLKEPRLVEYFARRRGKANFGLHFSRKGLAVNLFDEQAFIAKADLVKFVLFHRIRRYEGTMVKVPCLHIHYQGSIGEKVKEIHWDDLMWQKASGALKPLQKRKLSERERKQLIIETLNRLI